MRRKQEKALIALLEKPTIKEAADASEISQPTLFRYLQDPSFLKEYREAKKALVESALTELQKAAGEAVKTLKEIMSVKSPRPGSSIRASCAKTILEFSLKTTTLEDLLGRIEALEEKAP